MKSKQILLVEDNKADADLLCDVMTDQIGCSIAVVHDGEQAISYIKGTGKFAGQPTPSLVLLDLNLPKVCGREVLRVIKKDPQLRRIPILILTSSEAEQDVFECYDLHANCYMQKPVDLDRLHDLVQNLNSFWLQKVKFPMAEDRRKSG